MAAPREIVELVERFERNVDAYKSGRYNETQLRREFIDPFFGALGWDVENRGGRLGLQREVIHEDSVLVRDSMKNPDYGFYIGTARKFFVEAKKPSVNLENDVRAAFQLRSYAWSAGLPISLLTDFEEFSIYDCRIEPSNYDSPRVGLLRHFTYDKYVDHWDEIAALFSREAVLGGSLERYIESKKKARGTITVDEAFLREIDSWREILAKNIHRNNPDLTVRELNSSVQNTIDRIVFLRICEDRGIERFGQLKDRLTGETTIYTRLIELFRQADEKYNSGLFHFKEESGRGEPDRLTPSLKIDDVVLSEMIEKLYPPESPYRFSVIPAEILGHVYEQFLGKVISLGEDGGVEVEYKPEVRKAGGVYYTPTYIVEYIVEKTVGKLLAGQTPTTVSDLRILDPACGSGSFLIGAYQRLLDWHLEWYTRHLVPHLAAGKAESSREVLALLPPGGLAGANAGAGAGAGAVGNAAGAAKRRGRPRKSSAAASPSATNGQRAGSFPIFQAAGGEWRLATAERKRILLNNIYGVDIDLAAVEVTKLSLQLKVLEGENRETLSQQLTLFKERALPDLGENIKCGNSLIGPDFYDRQTSLFDEEEMYRVNAFDWEAEFPEIMGRGGFDAVIGNPPYGAALSQGVRHYLSKKYDVPVPITDSFVLFILKSLKLIHIKGMQSFIVPSPWLYMPSYAGFRKRILSDFSLNEIVLFRRPVFERVTVETCIELVKKIPPIEQKIDYIEIDADPDSFLGDLRQFDQQQVLNDDQSNLCLGKSETARNLFLKLGSNEPALGSISKIVCGITPYRKGKGTPPQSELIVDNKAFDADYKVDSNYRQYIMGRDFHRYRWQIKEQRWISYGDWLAEPRYAAPFNDPIKIVVRQTADSIIAQLDDSQLIDLKNVHNIRITVKGLTYEYLLGILNSKLITWWYRYLIPETGRVFAEVKVINLKKLPIRIIDFSNPKDTESHDQLVQLVKKVIKLNKKMNESNTNHEKITLQRHIDVLDKQIDKLVYELYGLNDEEIRIVETYKK